jgi:PadR family transcriptional regulator PadR
MIKITLANILLRHIYYNVVFRRRLALPRDVLGNFEYQVLAVLLRHPRDAYGVTIQERIRERTGHDVSAGALYTTLGRLQEKGMVESSWGEATPERGGRRKRYFKIKAAGEDAVRRSEAMLDKFGAADAIGEALA